MSNNKPIFKLDYLFKDLYIDNQTIKESMCVGKLAKKLSTLYNCEPNTIKDAELVGRYHDIGKHQKSIQDIINLDRKLFDNEKLIVDLHPELSYDILKEKGRDIIAIGARYHHENYDGSKKTYGLIGEQIPFLSRVTKIVDVFEALRQERPYKESKGVEEVIQIMINEKNTFDPELFKTFLYYIEDINNVYTKYN